MFNSVVSGMGRLLAYFYDIIPSYGVGIILLTVLVRVMMIPLAVKQAHIMEANRGNAERMRKLAPEIKKLKEKYRDDRARQYEEQKKLYDQHGVNMLGGLNGCLPMLLQMPVFYAMYSVLSGCNKVFGRGRVCTVGFHLPDGSALKTAILSGRGTFLGMNLNFRPSIVLQTQGFGRALPYYALISIMGYTMWFQSRQMMKAQPVVDPQMAQTQKVMQFLPLMLVFASLNFPAGLTVYWSATNIWAIGQQFLLMRWIGPASKGKAAPKPAGKATPEAKTTLPAPDASSAKSSPARTPSKPPAARRPSSQTGKTTNGSRRPAAPAASSARRRPAAQKARTDTGKVSEPSPKSGNGVAGKAPASPNGTASAGRPKGSGARKGSKGGRK